MKFLKSSIFFIYALFIHVVLLHIFSEGFYALYILCLLVGLYVLRFKFSDFSLYLFFIHVVVSIYIINSYMYEEFMFELQLSLNILDKITYINSEIMYVLTALHIVLLSNLKKFDSFWDIIDEKLLRD